MSKSLCFSVYHSFDVRAFVSTRHGPRVHILGLTIYSSITWLRLVVCFTNEAKQISVLSGFCVYQC